ncbi:MAG: hypothetical protein ACLQCU_01190 [Acidimicrobiales bacterium]|jgi:hypothetical protein
MRLRRKIVTAGLSVACGVALAACGQQVVTHVQAGDTVHSALTSVFKSPTTRFVITGQDLPGAASIADGSFSIVLTTSLASGASSSVLRGDQSVDVSILHESTDLVDLRLVGKSGYFRVDLRGIADLLGQGGQATFASTASSINKLAGHRGLGYLHQILLGKWVGVSSSTLIALARKLAGKMPSAASSISNLQKLSQNLQKINQMKLTVSASFAQCLRTWLSIHKKTADEYSLSLPARSFGASLVEKLAKPLAADLNEPSPSRAELSKAIGEISAKLSLRANLWISKGSVSRLQVFVPNSSAYLLIGVSHPAVPVEVPANSTMLTVGNLSVLFGASPLGGLKDLGSVSSLLS